MRTRRTIRSHSFAIRERRTYLRYIVEAIAGGLSNASIKFFIRERRKLRQDDVVR